MSDLGGTGQPGAPLALALVDRHGPVETELRARVAACSSLEQLRTLALDVARAGDRETIERLLAALTAPDT